MIPGPARAVVALAVAVGLALGIGAYTLVYARGGSYLTNDPAACANCHAMGEQFDGWTAGSYRAVAVCNDCHTPPGLIGKYTTKALNGFWHSGFWHSFAFTSGRFHEPIRITALYLDFVEAENSTGFHAPQEAARILGESIDFTRQGQLALRDGRRR